MAASWRASATSCWSAAPAPARPISPSPSPGPASERAHAAGATTSSTWSTTSRPNSAPDARAAPHQLVRATSSSSTNSATCPGRRAAALPPDEPALRCEPRSSITTNLAFGEWPAGRPQDDHRAARPSHPSLRDHRDRQRELALQEPLLSLRRPCLRPGCPGGPTGTPHAASLRAAQGATRSRAGPGTTSAVPLRVNFARRSGVPHTGPIWTPPGGKGRFGAPGEPGCSSISGLFVQAGACWP